jgi:hypothetical protein
VKGNNRKRIRRGREIRGKIYIMGILERRGEKARRVAGGASIIYKMQKMPHGGGG